MKDLPSGDSINTDYDQATDVTFIFSENGITKAELYSKEFLSNEVARPKFVDLLGGVRAKFYDDSLQVKSTLTAKYARHYPESNNILVRDSVVVVNKNGDKLETEELIWNQSLERFYTEKPVKITTDGNVSTGSGMEANQDFTWFRIHHQKGVIPVEAEQLTAE